MDLQDVQALDSSKKGLCGISDIPDITPKADMGMIPGNVNQTRKRGDSVSWIQPDYKRTLVVSVDCREIYARGPYLLCYKFLPTETSDIFLVKAGRLKRSTKSEVIRAQIRILTMRGMAHLS